MEGSYKIPILDCFFPSLLLSKIPLVWWPQAQRSRSSLHHAPNNTAHLSVSLLWDSGKRGRVAFLWKMILGVDEEAALLCCATLYDATAIYLWPSHVIQQLVIDMAWSCDKMASTLKPSVQWVHHYMQTVCLSKSIITGDLGENNSTITQQFQQAYILCKIIEDMIYSTSRNNHHGCNIHWSTANMMLFVKYLVCSNSCMTIYICMWLQIYVILHSHMYVVLI